MRETEVGLVVPRPVQHGPDNQLAGPLQTRQLERRATAGGGVWLQGRTLESIAGNMRDRLVLCLCILAVDM